MFVTEKMGGGTVAIVAAHVTAIEYDPSKPDECSIHLTGGTMFRVKEGQRSIAEKVAEHMRQGYGNGLR